MQKRLQSLIRLHALLICNLIVHEFAPIQAEIAAAREFLGWNFEPFDIPADYYAEWDAKTDGQVVDREWNERLAAYRAAYPELAAEFERRMAGDLPAN